MRNITLVALAALALSTAGCLQPDCKGQTLVCGGACVDIQTDNHNCGSCGVQCGNGTQCKSGVCSLTCEQGYVECDGSCIDPLTSEGYCGASGSCTGSERGTQCQAGQECNGGTCTCPAARPDHCGSGPQAFCTDFQTDPLNCGTCSNTCNSGALCSNGACLQSCSAGQTACPTDAPSYCATTLNDPNNCGSCGHSCNVGEVCANGTCG